ncbi:hypothetical protein CEXT_429981 [Caerostris extrusa]|uniref:Transmembrane protein n=1 Tax=Caerostris extrusa TaxID=172846 RepID=A0AAV4RXU8_CAEEX|nr:hypothetical protein CEXT_429981 [Caerostris extrusa]
MADNNPKYPQLESYTLLKMRRSEKFHTQRNDRNAVDLFLAHSPPQRRLIIIFISTTIIIIVVIITKHPLPRPRFDGQKWNKFIVMAFSGRQ